jgi:hypothetical protein
MLAYYSKVINVPLGHVFCLSLDSSCRRFFYFNIILINLLQNVFQYLMSIFMYIFMIKFPINFSSHMRIVGQIVDIIFLSGFMYFRGTFSQTSIKMCFSTYSFFQKKLLNITIYRLWLLEFVVFDDVVSNGRFRHWHLVTDLLNDLLSMPFV